MKQIDLGIQQTTHTTKIMLSSMAMAKVTILKKMFITFGPKVQINQKIYCLIKENNR